MRIGDRVKIVKNGRYDGDKHLGEIGTLIRIDTNDLEMPYLVYINAKPMPVDDRYRISLDEWWAAEVEPVSVPVVDRAYIERLGLGKQETHELLELYEAYLALAGR